MLFLFEMNQKGNNSSLKPWFQGFRNFMGEKKNNNNQTDQRTILETVLQQVKVNR